MNAEEIRIEWDEDGCYVDVTISEDEWQWVEGSTVRLHITDPEQLYDRVKGAIGPWLRERDEARFERHVGRVFACDPDESAGAYELTDPKHTDFHSVHADIWDAREGK